jgi:exodeoxyribonuclease VII large subunit
MGSTVDSGEERVGVLTVGEVTRRVRDALRGDPVLRDVWVEGEVGRVSISSAGHAYFSLKDDRGVLDCVVFSRELSQATFEPRTGLRVLAHGRVDWYDQQGRVQLYVDVLRPAGVGDLALRFEALKARLAAEGLFDAGRRRTLPARPRRVGVVTSPTGAVWHDVRTVVARRWPLTELVLVPCLVQGDAAPASIVAAFARVAAVPTPERPEVVILARGGGTLEDLWAFNAEAVVRAVVACQVPVVVGVGHEIDVTLADFAADVRAPTPSAAAELVVPDRARVRAEVDASRARITRSAAGRVAGAAALVAGERRALDRLGPEAAVALLRERAGRLLDAATEEARSAVARGAVALERAGRPLHGETARRVARARAAVESVGAALSALDPAATLERGYAIVRRAVDGRIVRAPSEVAVGESLAIEVAHGGIRAVVADEPST